jgi:hypothetical protein
MATDKTIADILEELSDAYPSFELTENRVKVWKKYLAQYDDALLTRAVEHYISTSAKAFPPSIPEIRDAATQLRVQIAGIPLALEAWDDVLHAKRPRRVVLDDIDPESGFPWVGTVEYQWIHPLVEKVAIMLGWPDKFPVSNEVGVDRAHFIKAYEGAIESASKLDRQIPQVREFVLEQRVTNVLPDFSPNVEEAITRAVKRLEVKK